MIVAGGQEAFTFVEWGQAIKLNFHLSETITYAFAEDIEHHVVGKQLGALRWYVVQVAVQ